MKFENDWKKFEKFSLPTNSETLHFESLKKIFDSFKMIYILNNGINSNKNKFGKEFYFQYNQDVKENIFPKINSHLIEIIEMDDFNVEEKLFLNRIAFYSFKKKLDKANFIEFFQYCLILQVKIKIFYLI